MSDEQNANPAPVVERRLGAPDLLAAAGAALLAYGAWRAWAPAGFMVLGAAMILAAILMAANERRPAK